jgi:hypothetical protein
MTKAALVAILAAAVLATQAVSDSQVVPPRCRTAQLHAKLFDSSGAAGTIVFSMALRNNGANCTLRGYPSLRLVGAQGPLPTHVVRGGLAILNGSPQLVLLARGQRASVLISYGDVPSGSERSCPHGTTLRLRPPDSVGWLSIRVATDACGRGTLHESPVLAGVQHAA